MNGKSDENLELTWPQRGEHWLDWWGW